MTNSSLPTLRWGIIGTGLISSWFVQDLTIKDRPQAKAQHIIQAVGSSSVKKGNKFVAEHLSNADSAPTVYGSHKQLYQDPNVQVVYIGLPHGLHKQACLDAIAAGKHVLCEKAFTINAAETKEVLAAAQARGVFIMEAMWLRFIPLVQSLHRHLHEERILGDVRRTFCDFGLDMNIATLGSESRLKNPSLGAGALLDIGIYPLTWGLLTLEPSANPKPHTEQTNPRLLAALSLVDSIDSSNSIIMHYPSTGRQGILTSTLEAKTDPVFCRIEGTKGHILVEGLGASIPNRYTIYSKAADSKSESTAQVYEFKEVGKGFYHEADAVALDIAAGKTENAVMPHSETLRVMEMMDDMRRQGGLKYPQDDA